MRFRGCLPSLALVAVLVGTAQAEERSFTIANIEYEGTKAFVPSTLVVTQGDVVKVKILNNVKSDPNQHGFALPDFKIEQVVTRGEPQEVVFTADKAGIFPIQCHLHPAHLGGQLVVLGKK
ncbi:MAG: cupredoxin domain-containing protein [Candidatus Binatia bacterium]